MTGVDRWAKCRAAAQRARNLLDSAGEGSLPVGLALVEALLERLGYDALYVSASDTLLGGGWAALFPDGQIAVCDSSIPRARRAFCLAHEVGHVMLHANGLASAGFSAQDGPVGTTCAASDIAIDGGSVDMVSPTGYLLPGEIYNPRQQRELEANVFALALLAPTDVLWQLFVHEGLDASAIAARLELSYSATLHALAGLLQLAKLPSDFSVPPPAAATNPEDTSASGRVRLDEWQRAAATASGAVLVRAGPGSGKTRTLVGRVEYLAGDLGVDPGRILVLTFSNRAAGELRDRLACVIGPAGQPAMVSTIHSFAHDLLRRYAAAAGLSPSFQVLDRAGALVILRRELPAFAKAARAQGHDLPLERPLRMLKGLLDVVGEAKNAMIDAGEFARRVAAQPEPDETAALQAAFFSWYEAVCAARDALDYDDLLLRAVALLRSRQDLRDETHEAYPYLLVDEYQDINEACGALLGELIPSAGLWAVGDPIQSIYRWRGADPEALGRWLEGRSGGAGTVQQLALNVNYRSRAPIVRLFAGVASAIRNGSAVDGRESWIVARDQSSEPASPVTLAVASDEHAEIAGIAQEIQRDVASGYGYDAHAVLCATNAHADKIASGLRLRGIPASRMVAPEDHPAVREVLSVLALAAGEPEALVRLAAGSQPGDTSSARSEEDCKGAVGLDSADVIAIVQYVQSSKASVVDLLASPPAEIAPAGREAMRVLVEFLKTLPVMHGRQSSIDAGSWMSAARYLFDSPYVAAVRMLKQGDLEAMRALSALLASASVYDRQPPELREPSFPAHLRLLLTAGIGLDGDRTDADGSVRVITIHAAKGLEFPVVFVPNLARGRFPARGRGGMRMAEAILGNSDADGRDADDKCVFFVALSRARDRLVLSYARRYGHRDTTPSPLLALADEAFVLEPPRHEAWQRESDDVQTGADTAMTGQPEQVAPDGIHVEVDQFGLEAYLQCPKRYYYAHTLGLAGAHGHDFPHYHTTLRLVLRRLAETAESVSPADARIVLDEEWNRPHAAHPHDGLYYDRALEVVLAATQARTPMTSLPAQSEYGVMHSVRLRSGTVRVEIDRVDRRDGETPVAVRFRSGRPSDDHRRETRVALYQAALDTAYGGGVVEQHYLLTGTVNAGRARPATLQARLGECDAALAGIAAGRFPANKGDHCPDCPFWLICPRG